MTTASNQQTVPALNNLEMGSIKSLVAYTAVDKNVSEDTVRRAIISHFGIDNIEKLPRNHFDDAIRFLIDIQSELLMMH